MITVTKRPYEYNFTGNPIVYEFFDNDATADNTLVFQARVKYRIAGTGIFTTLAVHTLSPYQGKAQIDISAQLHPYLQHYLPPVNAGAVPYNSPSASMEFYVEFRTISTTDVNTAWNNTEENFIRWGFKGGVHAFRYRGNAFFTQYLTAQKPFFTWQIRNRLAGLTERIYLTWLNLLFNDLSLEANVLSIQFKVRVFYTDQTDASTSYAVYGLKKGNWLYLPAGIKELGLDTLTLGKSIWYWQCWLEDTSSGGLGIVTEKFSFTLDNRNDYNNLQLFYRNSIGGLDTVRIRGVKTTTLDYELTTSQRSAAPDYAESSTPPALLRTDPATEQVRYKADIGYLGKEEQDRLRDCLLNREAYMLKYGRFWPLNLIQGGFDLTRSDAMKWNFPIEFTLADSGSEFYTPDIDLGSADPSTNVCATAVNITGTTITHAGGNATVVFAYNVAGSGTGLRWKVPGYQDIWQNIAFAASGTVSIVVPDGAQISLQMQAACSADNYGPVASYAVNTDPGLPADNSTIYNNTPVNTTWELKVNGTTVNSGTVNGLGYDGFYLPAITSAAVVLTLASVNPVQVDMEIGGIFYTASLAGGIATWANITAPAGVTIHVRNTPFN